MIIAHDYVTQLGGAERVVSVWAKHFPSATIYTSVAADSVASEIAASSRMICSWMQYLPGITTRFKLYFLLYPFGFRSLRPPRASLALISSSGYAHYLAVAPGTPTLCYCHTPPRFLWGANDYLQFEVKSAFVRLLLRPVLSILRAMDKRQAARITHYVANSSCVALRISTYYGRQAEIIFPPVDTDRFKVTTTHDGYYLIVSRLVGYKAIHRAVNAFSRSGKRLIIVGSGPDRSRLESLAGPSISFLGRVSDGEVTQLMAGCRAFVFPGYEDFGIGPVEANACGKPVIAYKKGGSLDTIEEGVNGCFFSTDELDDFDAAVNRLEGHNWDPFLIRKQAERFSVKAHLDALDSFIQRVTVKSI
jgi:glycosyltransferase involved in cell wall biosynthesis